MYKVQTTGYHSTTCENAEKILSEQHFIESRKNNEWLGNGVYFFAYMADADWWRKQKRFDSKSTEILSADLEYTNIQLLDLDDTEQLEKMERIVKKFAKLDGNTYIRAANLSMKKRAYQLCWACNLMKKIAPEIGILMYTFRRKYMCKCSLFEANQKQICVSDQSIIKSIKKVEGDIDAG